MRAWTIRIEGLSKSYGSQPVLQDLRMELAGGGIYCLMASSGAGKTTLLRLLTGLEEPDGGSVRYICPGTAGGRVDCSAGNSPAGWSRTPSQMTFACVFQEDRLCPGLGIERNIRLARPTVTGEALREEIQKLLPAEALSKPVSEFSGGMGRRAALLRAMLAPGEVILMDEPFTGLDEESRQTACRYVLERRAGRTLLFTTHHEEEGRMMGAVFCSF